MDVKIPNPPTFVPTIKEQAIHDEREAGIEVRREEKATGVSDLALDLAKEHAALVKRVKALEETTAAIKMLEETILAEKVVSLLRVGPKDTVLFTVPENIDIDDIPVSVHQSLKEKLGVAHVFFVTHGIDVSVVSPKE